ncbi:MAG: putative nucleotide-diphospho-sugar transferase [Pseudomonadota bacterium]
MSEPAASPPASRDPGSAEPRPSKGFVFAATGERYVAQARRAARSLRQHHPDAEIDLFTDAPTGDPVFTVEHLLGDSFFRPKIEALRRSRFARTLCFDSDTVFLAPLDDLFVALDKADILGVLALNRTGRFSPRSSPLSPAVPVVNSGVLALRRTEATQRFLRTWEATLRETGHNADQRSMRDLLFSGDVTFMPVGAAYNFKNMALLDVWGPGQAAPRILHCWTLHRGPAEAPTSPVHPREALGPRRIRRLNALRALEEARGQTGPSAKATRVAARAELEATAYTAQTGPEVAPQTSVVELLLGAETFAAQGLATVATALEARATQCERPHICCVGGTEGVRENVVPLLLNEGLALRAEVTCFEPTDWRRTRWTQGTKGTQGVHVLGPSACLHLEDRLIGAGATAELYGLADEQLHAMERDGTLPAAVLREAQGLATTDAERARDVAGGLAGGTLGNTRAPTPDAWLSRRTCPQMRLAEALRAARRPEAIDLLVLGSDGVGHGALDACDLAQTRPVLVLCDTAHLSPVRRLQVDRVLGRTHWLMPLGQHVLGIRRA